MPLRPREPLRPRSLGARGTTRARASLRLAPCAACPLRHGGRDRRLRRRVSHLRALLVSLVVLAVGAAAGAGGFAFEQTRVTWRPQVTSTADGWRISTSHGLRLGAAALGPGHIVWNAGPFTVLTELDGGESKLLGARAFAGDLSAPSTSARYVTWMDVHYQGPDVVWVYDTVSKRRVQLDGDGGHRALARRWPAPSPSGRPQCDRGTATVSSARSCRPASARSSPRPPSARTSSPAAIWRRGSAAPPTAEPPVITVVDVRSGIRRQVAPYRAGSGARLVDFAVAGRRLVWARDAGPGTPGQILSFDVDTGGTRVLAAHHRPVLRRRRRRPRRLGGEPAGRRSRACWACA